MTKIFKSFYGWQAETTIDLENGRALQFTTMKRHGGYLVTTAQVVSVKGDFVSYTMYQDFNKIVVSEKVRVTEKAVKAQHDKALKEVEKLKAEIDSFL